MKQEDQALQVVEESTAIAVTPEIRMSIELARSYPRDLAGFQDELMTAVSVDEETAAMCFYSKPQDGGRVIGPSVRLSELAVSAFGNLSAGSRPGRINREEKSVTGVGFAWDLQKNVQAVAEVTRPIQKRNGGIYSDSMIQTTLMAAAAIARRNAIFQVIPRIYIERACKKAQDIVAGEDLPMAQRRENMLTALDKLGAGRDLVLKSLGVQSAEMLTVGHILHLRGIWTGLQDGSLTLETAFPEPESVAERTDELPMPEDVIDAEVVEE